MKRVISISLTILIMFSGIRLDIASHYCDRNYIGSRVSFSREPATCGMENQHENSSSFVILKSHCCDNLLFSFSVYSQYITSECKIEADHGRTILFECIQSDNLVPKQDKYTVSVSGMNLPPGSFNPTEVCQQVICNYRI